MLTACGDGVYNAVSQLGDLAEFAWQALWWGGRRRPCRGTLLPTFYAVGVRSVPVVAVTGLFIGMVLAVQSYGQFAKVGLASQLGGIINTAVVRELGPVLAATMLCGRVGSAMAAQLGTMRVTEQIDALGCLGVHPVHYLVVPRVMACVLLIPLLTILANFMGVLGGELISTQVFHIDAAAYWRNAEGYVSWWDLLAGLIKPMAFGAAIGLVSCHRGFRSRAGAEGVGRAATEAFVLSFVAVLGLDFFLVMLLNALQPLFCPGGGPHFA
jgi:phospholipid/cholesterol/gamma-HCH transport system permease protein